MPLADPPRPSMELTSVQQVVDYLIGYVRWFSDFINHIDTLNVEELDAAVVNTGILNANLVKIAAANGLKSLTIDTNGIVANNGSVDTMKFDLATGLLTIVSALIQSSTGYPRVELNNSTNLLAAYLTANDAIRVVPNFSGGNPAIYFTTGGSTVAYLQDFGTVVGLITPFGGKDVQLGSGKALYLSANNGIEMTCAGIRINGNIGASGTVYASATPGGVANVPITFTNGIRTT